MSKKAPPPDHVPGPVEEAAVKAFFERGSMQVLEKNRWRMATFISLTGMLVMGVLMTVIASRQEVHVMQVAKLSSGELQAAGVAKVFSADEEAQMAWAINYAQVLTEITPAIWRRNADKAIRLSSGVAADQVRAYLGRPDANPASILQKHELYVREFHRKSVNKVANDTFLVRYDLVSRPAPSSQAVTNSFAMTVTLAQVAHKTRDDVFFNPAGLVAVNFSISDETAVKR